MNPQWCHRRSRRSPEGPLRPGTRRVRNKVDYKKLSGYCVQSDFLSNDPSPAPSSSPSPSSAPSSVPSATPMLNVVIDDPMGTPSHRAEVEANIATCLSKWGMDYRLHDSDRTNYNQTFGCLGNTDERDVPTYSSCFMANASKQRHPDIFTYDEALADPKLRDSMIDAMEVEIEALERKDAWDEVLKEHVIKAGHKIVPSTWVLRIKRKPDGSFLKCKARIWRSSRCHW